MLVFDVKCPHCFRDVVFNGYHILPWGHPAYSPTLREGRYAIFAQCPKCHKAVIGITGFIRGDQARRLEELIGERGSHQVLITDIYPKPPPIYYEEAVPDSVRDAFKEAQVTFRAGAFRSAAMMCRAVLESALKIYLKELFNLSDGKVRKLGLKGSIDYLIEKCVLPEPMGDWAHHIRLLGNEAVHELSANKEEAEELIGFTIFTLEYLFALPCKLQRAMRKV